MFESAETGHAVDKKQFSREAPALRTQLLQAQAELLQSARFPVLILVSGVDGAGKGETVNLLKEWMDPRHIQAHALGEPTEEERLHPPMWRFWRDLPPRGKIGVFFGSWYTAPILDRVYGKLRAADLDQAMAHAVRFERMLADEGALILKLWFHLSKKHQRERLRKLESDPDTRWRVTARDWRHFRLYDKFYTVSEHALRSTGTAEAPWHVVEGYDDHYRSLAVARLVLSGLRARLDTPKRKPARPAAGFSSLPRDGYSVLDGLDLTRRLEKKKYDRQLEKYAGALNLLTRGKKFRDRAVVAVFEGWDAAGKGSCIRRVTGALDVRQYDVWPIAAPSAEELAQPYLWRFWRHIPRLGRLAIFDRSWYGRVLVERVEKLCSGYDWQRAYGEINEFEEEMAKHGIVIAKFWLHVSPGEQLRRFKEREHTPFKRYKITADDWRNRKKRALYEQAVCDMVEHTSTDIAPWTLVEAEDQRYARVKVMKTLCRALEKAL
jgi:polyphosphate:AMP phosphotransferase